MTSRSSGFDKIAWCYDLLAKLVFGNRLMDAQLTYLHHIKPGAQVLILGGGTGTLLKMLLEKQPTCNITYIDASMAMLQRAQKRRLPGTITFIHGNEHAIPYSNYDTVLTPFYLDMFSRPGLDLTIRSISAHMAPGAAWIATDFFQSERFSEKVLLFMMYSFFRITTGIQAKSLPDWKGALEQNGWIKTESHFDGFIVSAVFRTGRSL